MTKGAEQLDELLNVVRNNDIHIEVRRLRDIEEWARGTLPFVDGDQVVLRKSRPLVISQASGWWPWRECLRPGQTGVITEIKLGRFGWYGLFTPDTEWELSSMPGDPQRRTSDRKSLFMIGLKHLRKRRKGDRPLGLPADAKPWSF